MAIVNPFIPYDIGRTYQAAPDEAIQQEQPKSPHQLTFRQFNCTDFHCLQSWYNNPDIYTQLMDGSARPASFKDIEALYDNYLTRKQDLRIIVENKVGVRVGALWLLNQHPVHRSVDVHILVDPSEQRKGIGSAILEYGKDMCFSHLNLYRMEALIIDGNIASRRLFVTHGFSHEGTKYGAAFKDGKYVDVDIWGYVR